MQITIMTIQVIHDARNSFGFRKSCYWDSSNQISCCKQVQKKHFMLVSSLLLWQPRSWGLVTYIVHKEVLTEFPTFFSRGLWYCSTFHSLILIFNPPKETLYMYMYTKNIKLTWEFIEILLKQMENLQIKHVLETLFLFHRSLIQ
jgi:hypothetical protein